MERLTFEGNFCDIAHCGELRYGSQCEDGCCLQRKVWGQLKSYEDTGLTSVQCAVYGEFEKHLEAAGMTINNVLQWIRAEQDGRLVVLPCRVGDTVYAIASCAEVNTIIDDDYEHGTGAVECPFENTCDIEECDDNHVRIFESRCDGFIHDSYGGKEISVEHITPDGGWMFGQNVFLARETAEATLKGEQHE